MAEIDVGKTTRKSFYTPSAKSRLSWRIPASKRPQPPARLFSNTFHGVNRLAEARVNLDLFEARLMPLLVGIVGSTATLATKNKITDESYFVKDLKKSPKVRGFDDVIEPPLIQGHIRRNIQQHVIDLSTF